VEVKRRKNSSVEAIVEVLKQAFGGVKEAQKPS
jgi:hypothetical protein